jgi:hypothetical protein
MAVDSAGRPWSRSPSDIDAHLAKLHAETRQSRINRGPDPETGIKIVALRSDLAPEQRTEARGSGASDSPARERSEGRKRPSKPIQWPRPDGKLSQRDRGEQPAHGPRVGKREALCVCLTPRFLIKNNSIVSNFAQATAAGSAFS